MPTLTQVPPQKVSKPLFIGLQSYTEAQSDMFFGRDEEIDRLTNLVKANTLTIVFGKSGTGKTSLLNAGVFPRLRRDYCLPFRIRLEFNEDSPDLVTQIKNILTAEIDKYGFAVESYPSTETLWEYFHREQLWKSVTPILIFDQFEEIFTLAKRSHFGTKELNEFWNELADLIENSIPDKLKDQFLNDKENFGFNYKIQKIKTVFSFREEFLPEFESITAKIPSLKYSRFRLMPMNGNQAYEVITKTWQSNINGAQANKIVSFFASDENKDLSYELMEIEPSLLSQVCSFIDKERVQAGKETITSDFLSRFPKEIILSSIYNEVLNDSNAAVLISFGTSASVSNTARPVNEFIEDKLITDEGYRTKYVLNEQDQKIRPGIEILKAKYFVRDDGKSIELTHDVLTPLIKRDREERRKAHAMALAKKKANRRALFIVIAAALVAGLVLYFTSEEAKKVTEKAEERKNELTKQINAASVSLDSLKNSIDSSEKVLEKIQTQTNSAIVSVDSTRNDSGYVYIRIDSLNAQHEIFAKAKTELEKELNTKSKEIEDFKDYRKISDSTTNDAKRRLASLQKRIALDSARLALSQTNYRSLYKQYDDYIQQVSRLHIEVEDTTSDIAYDTNSVHVDLSFGTARNGKSVVPKNLKIYLIPDNAANKKIIRKASVYEMYCDEINLDNATGKKVAKYKDKVYKFYDVPPGKYFVKICAYYGGFYSFTKSVNGNRREKFDGSPPVQ